MHEEEDVTANALALAIFKDNLKLHKEIERLRSYWNALHYAIFTEKDGGPERWYRYECYVHSLHPPEVS